MSTGVPKLVIGFIIYGKSAVKYLPHFLPSLFSQSYEDCQVIAIDNNENNDNDASNYIKENYPQIDIEWGEKNLGFARAYNRMINKTASLGVEHFLALNPDMVLDSRAIELMLKKLEADSKIASAAPKIYVWDYKNNKKTNILDSCGIREVSALRFAEVGRGKIDQGQFDNSEIIGPSGAAAMYRLSALEKVKQKNGYFDELMFMYEEDCDLAYRLKLAGYDSQLVPEAHIYHDRTASGKGTGNIAVALNRRSKSKRIRSWAFLHKHIIFFKFWKILKIKEKFEVLWFAFRMFVYALIFEQFLLKEYSKLWQLRNKINIYYKTNEKAK